MKVKTLETNYFGKKYIEQLPKISVKELYEKIEKKVRQELLELEFKGIDIIHTKANYWGYRVWFQCPICKRKVFNLYEKDWITQCRKCTGLKYKKQRYKWMVEEKVFKN